eukprot:7134411-Prymnesium_polylepis.1
MAARQPHAQGVATGGSGGRGRGARVPARLRRAAPPARARPGLRLRHQSPLAPPPRTPSRRRRWRR